MRRYRSTAGGPEAHARFRERHGIECGPDFRTVVVTEVATGRVVAATAYEHFTYGACEMHIWVDDPAVLWSRTVIREAFAYPFLQINLETVYAWTPADQTRSLGLQMALGFKERYRLRDGFRKGVDLVLTEMRKSDCRWLHLQRKAA